MIIVVFSSKGLIKSHLSCHQRPVLDDLYIAIAIRQLSLLISMGLEAGLKLGFALVDTGERRLGIIHFFSFPYSDCRCQKHALEFHQHFKFGLFLRHLGFHFQSEIQGEYLNFDQFLYHFRINYYHHHFQTYQQFFNLSHFHSYQEPTYCTQLSRGQ